MEHIVFGFAIALYCFLKQRWVFKTDWLTVAKFLAFMAFVTAIRIGLSEVKPTQSLPQGVGFFNFLFVWLEDIYYMLPIYFFKEYLKAKKWIWVSVAVAMSLYFAHGHLPYGLVWASMTLLYPYFISFRYGMKYGFGSVMIMHILYDFITLLTVKLSNLMKVMGAFGI